MARFNVSRCNRAATAAARHWHVVLQALIAIVTFALMCEELVARSRAQLWQAGGERGWNSDPSMRIYFYANHEEPPAIPLIWSQRLTDSNLAVAGLSLALTLQRGVLAFLGFDWALFNIASDIFLALFWSHSAAAQMSSDLTDLEHVSLRPWYLERGCSAVGPSERSPCVLGQACFVMAVVSL
ncbi:hypothetical protein Micbo1qcDRAFT_127414 [Microdochium bolleyi]|uniref:Uncharacterized protein n=1 Tax=Microdochium bolleyi TaxID=196109 RepID=A0A136ILF1_9PEZI|nr:hypothetical protein Micbo1qcDRAFT_127414 [Microdochium bolleyi]